MKIKNTVIGDHVRDAVTVVRNGAEAATGANLWKKEKNFNAQNGIK